VPDPRPRSAPRTAPPAPTPRTAPPSAIDPPGAPPAADTPKPGSFPWIDLAIGAALSVVALVAALDLPVSPLRYLLTLPMLLLVPGYLLLQAFAVPAASGARRGWQALAAIGLSPAVVGLLALSTAIVQGAFRVPVILAVSTLASVALATTAFVRRRSLARSERDAPAPAPAAAAVAATAKSGPLRP